MRSATNTSKEVDEENVSPNVAINAGWKKIYKYFIRWRLVKKYRSILTPVITKYVKKFAPDFNFLLQRIFRPSENFCSTYLPLFFAPPVLLFPPFFDYETGKRFFLLAPSAVKFVEYARGASSCFLGVVERKFGFLRLINFLS